MFNFIISVNDFKMRVFKKLIILELLF